MINKFDEIKRITENYKKLTRELQEEKFTHHKQLIDPLLTGYKQTKDEIRQREKEYATKYNIFDVLNVKYAETLTHTPFLTNLLNPQGSHGQGNLFLKNFLHGFIPEQKNQNFILEDSGDYFIKEEKVTPLGRIDIYIKSNNPKKRFGIVIENKIYAADQYKQLKRYYDFLRKYKKLADDHIMVFYLTPHGDEPDEFTSGKRLKDSPNNMQVFKSISYKKDISGWLKETHSLIQPEKVKLMINQYLNILEKL